MCLLSSSSDGREMVLFGINQSAFGDEVRRYKEYIAALDEELKKIQVFERELPLCLQLVSQAIERCRQQMSSLTITESSFDGQSDQCSDQTSSDPFPVLEEFIPMKATSSTNYEDLDHDDHDQRQLKQQLSSHDQSMFTCTKDWLASAQLSIQAPNPPIEEELFSEKTLTMEKKKTTIGSSADGDGSGGEDRGRSKKERRCWSPELHRRFLHALQQLGGAHVATPKQIKELMKVNGLTNDEIKSHLQKYRLHAKRLNTTINNDTITPQLLVVGRIWMPPLDYTSTNTTTSLLPPSMTSFQNKTKQQ
ncbi:hypothetical protein QVD17_31952 [Tagetes erecta]|uniref:HTH myb-type domain-containing protein n=1 Tax=Tagetes erecta TaxID=13708 RepID=A0AAD8NP14_TARER|nr:hypothetical protein QVD17_31952 [Tagetes erecta]